MGKEKKTNGEKKVKRRHEIPLGDIGKMKVMTERRI